MPFMHCRTCYVDTSRLVFDAISFDGNSFFKDVTYTNTGLKQSGSVAHMEVGDTVVIDVQGQGVNKLLEHYGSRQENKDGQVQNTVGRGGAPEAHRALPGDHFLSGPDGAFLELLRGGFAAIGASPLCQTLYLAVENLIRTVSLNSEAVTSGSRIFTINDNGVVTTRACFNSTDVCFSKGALTNPSLESENFEFQFDLTADGFTMFVGELDEETNKRKNQFVFTAKQNGDLHVISGDRILFSMYPSGALTFKMVDENRNVIYDKSVITTSEDRVVVQETIKGDYVRLVDGDVYDEVTGTRNSKAALDHTAANVIEQSSMMNRKKSGMNISEIDIVPDTRVTIK